MYWGQAAMRQGKPNACGAVEGVPLFIQKPFSSKTSIQK
jgi:hypothetical protein